VDITLPKSLRLEPVPDNPRRAAILWGPLVLAGDLGPEVERGSGPTVPVLVAAERPVSSWLEAAGESPVRFRTDGVGRDPDPTARVHDVDFVPFYRLPGRRYAIYWDLFTPEEWEGQKAEYVADAERLRALEAATVAYLQPGETVFEREFNYQSGEGAAPQRIMGRPGRRGTSWFSYDLPIDPSNPVTLLATYYSGDRRGTPSEFEILVDGTRVADQVVEMSDPHRFFEVTYAVPQNVIVGKDKVTVRFQAKEGSQIATVFELRTIRGEVPR
jgi:hypothetical protein